MSDQVWLAIIAFLGMMGKAWWDDRKTRGDHRHEIEVMRLQMQDDEDEKDADKLKK